jgi:hypothetical protein
MAGNYTHLAIICIRFPSRLNAPADEQLRPQPDQRANGSSRARPLCRLLSAKGTLTALYSVPY